MRTNTTKAKLKAGQTVFGCFLRYPDPGLAEMLGYQEWDFFVFDGEHGSLEPRDCENLVRTAELNEVTPIVRVTTNLASIILRFMDTGVQGLHVPLVNSAVEAEKAVRAVKYQPLGTRGLAGVRAADYAQAIPLSEYTQQANAETLVVVQIETAEAVKHLSEIVAVEGLDVVFIGPTDLSHSLGVTGQMEHPKMKAAVEEIVQMVEQSKAALGTLVPSAKAARVWCDRGARYITVTFESLLSPAIQHYLRSVRE